MFGLQTLDVAIGLIFIFLLLSLVVTAANELIAAWLKRRSSTMWRGVVQLLGGEEPATEVYSHPLVSGINDAAWLKKYREKLPFKKRPSYIPSRSFALALLDTLAPAKETAAASASGLRAALNEKSKEEEYKHLAKSLIVLLDDAGNDIEKFKGNIEAWFDASMERVTGWYKRRTQWIVLLLAVIVAVWMNADTLVIANTLWRDPSIRSALVAQAQQFAEEQRKEMEKAEAEKPQSGPPPPPERLPYEAAEAEYETAQEKFEESKSRLESLAIPLGWRENEKESEDRRERLPRNGAEWGRAVRHHFLGWLLTALAISLGAPFWFDMLNKVISIRAAGKKPGEKPKVREKQTQLD